MNLSFSGVTNRPYSLMMLASFKLPNEQEVVVSSDATSFYIFDDEESDEDTDLIRFELEWCACYLVDDVEDSEDDSFICDGDILRYLTPADVEMFNESLLVAIGSHDDAPQDYMVKITSWRAH